MRRDPVLKWLLDGDPAIRWQAIRDLTDAGTLFGEQHCVATEGWGARLLELKDPDGKTGKLHLKLC
jgi:hypothetical protein